MRSFLINAFSMATSTKTLFSDPSGSCLKFTNGLPHDGNP
nr:MAG TPA: hypothetical protein [Caudoviricetes sp.]